MNYYQRKKQEARQEAIEFQQDIINERVSWVEILEVQDYFYLIARKWGLVREFKENAII